MALEKLEAELQQDAGSQVSSLHKERPFENSKIPVSAFLFLFLIVLSRFFCWVRFLLAVFLI
jgi:hypothetical protein